MAIVGEVETTMWGKTLIGEATHDSYSLMPVGNDESNAINWEEIEKKEWMIQFKPDNDSEIEKSTNAESDHIY